MLITSIGGWILTMRNNVITTLAEDYVRMGRAKGLSNRRIMYHYAAPQRDPAQPDRLRDVARLRDQRRDPDRVRLQLPRARATCSSTRSTTSTTR